MIGEYRRCRIGLRELDRVAAPLAALEEAFRPLLQDLTPDLEPDTALRLGEDEL